MENTSVWDIFNEPSRYRGTVIGTDIGYDVTAVLDRRFADQTNKMNTEIESVGALAYREIEAEL